MQIKVFKAATVKEAMEQVKNELGQDAVILHTKKYKEGGILGYGSKEVVEVTAAIEEEMPPKPLRAKKKEPEPSSEKKVEDKPAPSPSPPRPSPLLPSSILNQYKTNGTAEGIELAAAMGVKKEAAVPPPMFPSFDTEPLSAASPVKPKILPKVPEAVQPFKSLLDDVSEAPKTSSADNQGKARIIKAEASHEQKIIPAMPAFAANESTLPTSAPTEQPVQQTTAPSPVPSSPEDATKIQNLEDQLAQMKSLLAQVISKEPSKDVLSLQEALRRQDVNETILDDLAAQSGVGDTLADVRTPGARETLKSYLTQTVSFSSGIELVGNGARIAALIGPTGVGKTTTLAKIAARFVLDQGISAALITADTYRISAVEQLKTYSDILGLPLEIVYSPSELRLAIRKYEKKQLILIDTAGRSQHNEYQMKELQELLKTNSRIEKHLVISSTTKESDALDILEKFSACKPDRIIFTKTDETMSSGIILNMLHKRGIALSYLANGQSVPDDIFPADAESLADVLLRE